MLSPLSREGRSIRYGLSPGASLLTQCEVELSHRRSEAFAGGVHCDEGGARFADVGAGGDFAGDAGESAFGAAHDEDLIGASGATGTVPAFLEERDRQIQDLARRDLADRLLLVGGPAELVVELVHRRLELVRLARVQGQA